jgi:hypothetical protein
VDPLLRPRVVDVAEVDERAADRHAGLLEHLAARGGLELLVRIRGALRDAPRRAAVVVARRVHQQDLDATVHEPIEQGARRELCACVRHPLATVQCEGHIRKLLAVVCSDLEELALPSIA